MTGEDQKTLIGKIILFSAHTLRDGECVGWRREVGEECSSSRFGIVLEDFEALDALKILIYVFGCYLGVLLILFWYWKGFGYSDVFRQCWDVSGRCVSLSNFHFHTFTFIFSLSHFHFHIFTFTFSHLYIPGYRPKDTLCKDDHPRKGRLCTRCLSQVSPTLPPRPPWYGSQSAL